MYSACKKDGKPLYEYARNGTPHLAPGSHSLRARKISFRDKIWVGMRARIRSEVRLLERKTYQHSQKEDYQIRVRIKVRARAEVWAGSGSVTFVRAPRAIGWA